MRGIFIGIPWLLGFLGSLGFAWVGTRSGGGAIGWGVAGGLCSVLATGIVLGLANAATVPYSEQHWIHVQWLATVAAVSLMVLALILAWFLSPYRAHRSA